MILDVLAEIDYGYVNRVLSSMCTFFVRCKERKRDSLSQYRLVEHTRKLGVEDGNRPG